MMDNIWKDQKEYNKKIFAIEGIDEKQHWTRQYLLGIASQINEVLNEIHWKRNRKEAKIINRFNVLDKIVDLYKFTISLAQVWGFSEYEFLTAVEEKNEILNFKLAMEFKEPLVNRNIIMFDIDGTVADYQGSFLLWLAERNIDIPKDVSISSLLIDSALELNYPEYYRLKEEFEEMGGYRYMLPYPDAVDALKNAKNKDDYYLIAVTARPPSKKRIFKDTLVWLTDKGISVDELYLIGDTRVLLACELKEKNNVELWDDDPGTLSRASKSQIRTYARKHEYNKEIDLPFVKIIDKFF